MGLAPTGRSFSYEHIHILRFEGGKVAEHWGIHDHLSFLQQLGAMPARPQPAAG